MNSESFKDFEGYPKKNKEDEKERIQRNESIIINEAKLIEGLLSNPGWKILDRDLGNVQAGLMNKLRYGVNLTKNQMDRYIDQLNVIDYFRKSPTNYLTRMQLLLKRKILKGD